MNLILGGLEGLQQNKEEFCWFNKNEKSHTLINNTKEQKEYDRTKIRQVCLTDIITAKMLKISHEIQNMSITT